MRTVQEVARGNQTVRCLTGSERPDGDVAGTRLEGGKKLRYFADTSGTGEFWLQGLGGVRRTERTGCGGRNLLGVGPRPWCLQEMAQDACLLTPAELAFSALCMAWRRRAD